MKIPTSFHAFLMVCAVTICACGPATAMESGKEEVQPIGSKVFQGKAYYSSITPVATVFLGEVVEKPVNVGDLVQEGDVLLKIALRQKDRYELGKRIDMELPFLKAEMNIAALKHEAGLKEKQIADEKRLFAEGMASKQSGQDLEGELSFLRLKIKQAEEELQALKKDLKRERTFIGETLNQKVHNEIPEYALILAPCRGYIVWENENIAVGGFASGRVFEIGFVDPMIIRTQLYESDSSQLQPGDKADVTLEYKPQTIIKAVVKSISWLPLDKSIDKPSYYIVDLEIPNPDLTFKEGYTVRIVFTDLKMKAIQ